MAYKKPAIMVAQEFSNSQPKLTSHSLPVCYIGPTYKIFNDLIGGKYTTGNTSSLKISGLDVSLVLDKSLFNPNILESEQFPISVKFIDVILSVIPNKKGIINENSLDRLTCETSNVFEKVQPKDIIYLELNENGNIKKHKFQVKTVISSNEIELSSSCDISSRNYSFSIERSNSDYVLERDLDFNVLDDNQTIEINGVISVEGLKVKSASILYSYRAYRNDLAQKIYEISSPEDIDRLFGLGQIHPGNPLAFAASIGLQNTTTKILLLGLNKSYIDPIKGGVVNEELAYLSSLSVIKRNNVYCVIPLTNNSMVIKLFENFVKEESHFEKGREKTTSGPLTVNKMYDICNGSCKKTDGIKVIGTAQANGVIKKSTSIVVSSSPILNVYAGDTLHIIAGSGLSKSFYNIQKVSSDFKSFTIDKFTPIAANDINDASFEIKRSDGIIPHKDGALLTCKDAKFITGSNPINTGHKISFLSGKLKGISSTVVAAISDTEVVVKNISQVSENSISDFNYIIEGEYTNREHALTVSQIAKSYANRRFVAIWPPLLTKTFANKKIIISSYYGSCAIGAMTAGQPPHQSFTNLSIGGIDGVIGSNDQFDEDDLNVIADGGVLIFCQDFPGAPVYIRHSLTSDRSSIKFQEYMITKNVDYVTRFIRESYKKYLNGYNVTNGLLDDQKRLAQVIITYLRDKTVLPKIGGIIRDGKLLSCKFGEQIDETELEFSCNFPVPLNNIMIKIKA